MRRKSASFLHRRELVAFRSHAEVRQPLLFEERIAERLVERAEGPSIERMAERVAVHPRRERTMNILEAKPVGVAPCQIVALLGVGGRLLRARILARPFHRRAGGDKQQEYRAAKSFHLLLDPRGRQTSPWGIVNIYPWICFKLLSRSSISRRRVPARPPTGSRRSECSRSSASRSPPNGPPWSIPACRC